MLLYEPPSPQPSLPGSSFLAPSARTGRWWPAVFVSLSSDDKMRAPTNPRRSRTRTLLISCPRLWEDRLLIASAPAFLRCSTTFENLTSSRTFSYGHRGRLSNQLHFRFSFRGCWSSRMTMLDTDRYSTRLPTFFAHLVNGSGERIKDYR